VKRSTVISPGGVLHPDASASLGAEVAEAEATALPATVSFVAESAPAAELSDRTALAEVPFGLHPAEIAQAASAATPRLHPALDARGHRRRGA